MGLIKNILFILLLLPQLVIAQISGIINIYTKVTGIDVSCNKLTVTSSGGFAVGDTVLIIQMKGATIDQASNTGTSGTLNGTHGLVTSYNNAGNYEFAEIAAISGNDIYLKHTLLKSYTPAGSVQLISVPQYTNVTISGTLTAQAWDGNTGGVLVFEAAGTITFNADINVNGKGFRGGAVNPGNGSSCNGVTSAYAASTSTSAAAKGEGINDMITGRESARGRQANGGGGGSSNNYGGGGGGNFGSGGRGGDESQGCNAAFFPQNYWAMGGAALAYSNAANKIFMGGGGGGGHQNNYIAPGPQPGGPSGGPGATPGGRGGGIVIIRANEIIGNSRSILAKGDSLDTPSWGDSGGGGGAGGTILLSVPNYLSPIYANANGGKGDRVYIEVDNNLGPGGGGGGGVVWVSTATANANIITNVSGGQPGISWDVNTTFVKVCFCPWNAAAGGNGAVLTNLVLPRSSTEFNQTCIALPVQLLKFSAKVLNNKVKLEWTTASEKNNEYFIIEKSHDLNSFELVATVKGQGNSNTNNSYFVYDNTPNGKVTYYRLSQKDEDGKVQILKISHVSSVSSGKMIQKVYPQPFTTELTIELNESLISTETEIFVFNTIGQDVFFIKTHHSNIIHLPLSFLPRGIYFLTVSAGGQKETVKLVKSE
jgi:hypothetical protein